MTFSLYYYIQQQLLPSTLYIHFGRRYNQQYLPCLFSHGRNALVPPSFENLNFPANTKPLEIALPESEYDRSIVKRDYDSIITKPSAVNVEKAQCFNPADLEAIHKAIGTESSCQTLNDIIKTQLRVWIASTDKLQFEKEEQKANPDGREIRTEANQAGRAYQAQGDFANPEPLLRKALRVAEEISEDREKDQRVAAQLNNLAELLRAQVGLKVHTSFGRVV